MTKSFDISMLDKNTQNALYLTWVSCKDFNALNNPDNQELLNRVWASIKNRLIPFFVEQTIKLETIASDLREFVLSVEPTLSFAYNPERNALLFNLWVIFFECNGENIIPSIPWKLAGEIVHEHDHYLFLSSHGMIGKDEKTSDEFFKNHWSAAETKAFSAQAEFLKNCKKKISSFPLQEFRVTGWTSDGKPLHTSYYKCTLISKDKMIEQLDLCISNCLERIALIEDGYEYNKAAPKNDKSINLKIARLLSLPIKLNNLEKPFPETRIKL